LVQSAIAGQIAAGAFCSALSTNYLKMQFIRGEITGMWLAQRFGHNFDISNKMAIGLGGTIK
jgi:hypothetical protein